MLDPSTNVNPIQDEHRDELEEVIHPDGQNPEKKKKKSKRRTGEVSKHTFYIENSQSRLKLFARNEVSDVSQDIHKVAFNMSRSATNVTMDRCLREDRRYVSLSWRQPFR